MVSPKATPALLAHVQRGRMPSLAPDSPRLEARIPRPRPVLDEVVFDVPLDLIVADSPVQTREPFDPVASDEDAALLAVVRQGLWTPPVVLRPADEPVNGQVTAYQIEDGHRRVAAHRLAGRAAVRAVVTRHNGREADLTTLRANTFKRLPPVPQAQAIARVRERHGLAFKTIAELAGLTPRYVSELMRMLEGGPKVVEAVGEGRLSVRDAARIGRATEVEANAPGAERRMRKASGAANDVDAGQPVRGGEPLGGPADRVARPATAEIVRGRDGIQEMLAATQWLDARRTADFAQSVRAHPCAERERLAALLILATESHLGAGDALALAPDFVGGRVGRSLVTALDQCLRLDRAVRSARTGPQERQMLARLGALLTRISGDAVAGEAAGHDDP